MLLDEARVLSYSYRICAGRDNLRVNAPKKREGLVGKKFYDERRFSLRGQACRERCDKNKQILGAGYEKESKRLGNDCSKQKFSIPPSFFFYLSFLFPSNPSPTFFCYEIWDCPSPSVSQSVSQLRTAQQSVYGVSGNLRHLTSTGEADEAGKGRRERGRLGFSYTVSRFFFFDDLEQFILICE